MTQGGQKRDEKKAVEIFLAYFDDDIDQAKDALKHYGGDGHSASHQPKSSGKEPTTPVLLSVNDLKKTYKLGKQKLDVLNGVSFRIHEGEFIAITGASGSGKSTLLQLIGGLDKPTSGEVVFDSTNIATLSDAKLSDFRRQTIGFVFQFFYLQPFLKLGKNLEVPGMFARSKYADRQERTEQLAAQVGLAERLAHLPKELSGGQMQRAAIARALFNKPKILLADEPTGNLDSENSKAIIELFEQIRRDFGTTIVVVTHDQSIANRADRQLVMKDGLLV